MKTGNCFANCARNDIRLAEVIIHNPVIRFKSGIYRINFMQINKLYKVVLVIIFVGSVILRLGLSNYNREANDPHMPVIRYIMKNNELPVKADCWECFQPKLFHYTIAKILNILGLSRRNDDGAQIIFAQMMNFLAGTVIIIAGWMFISRLSGNHIRLKLLTFALLAFNPQLIGINSQVTNDTFLIMFCTLAVYCTHLFLKKTNAGLFFFIIILSVLAVATKTNGWVTVVAISMALLIKSWLERRLYTGMLIYAAGYLLTVPILATLDPLTQYIQNYKQFDSPVAIALDKQPRPLLFEETYIPYAGILSIQSGFFTFRLADLIANPVTDLGERANKSTHRTSLWTHLYGSANSTHFENYPPSWRTSSEEAFMLSRGIFLFALLPTILILAGFVIETFATAKALFTQNTLILQDTSFGLFALLFIGHILFIALYAFEYRLYIFFKAIFIYPALLAFSTFFLKGLTAIFSSARTKHRYVITLEASFVLLVFLYILDVASLIWQLLPNGLGINILFESLIHIWR